MLTQVPHGPLTIVKGHAYEAARPRQTPLANHLDRPLPPDHYTCPRSGRGHDMEPAAPLRGRVGAGAGDRPSESVRRRDFPVTMSRDFEVMMSGSPSPAMSRRVSAMSRASLSEQDHAGAIKMDAWILPLLNSTCSPATPGPTRDSTPPSPSTRPSLDPYRA